MKILIIAHFLPHPPHGGAVQRNLNLLRGLAKKHEVHYLTFNQSIHLPTKKQVAEAVQAISPLCRHLEVFDIPTDGNKLAWYALLGANLFSSDPYSVWRYYSPAMIRAIKRMCAEHRFDVVVLETIALAQYARFVGSVPCVLCHQNHESALLFHKAAIESNPLAKLYVRLQARKLSTCEQHYCRMFAANTVVSEQDLSGLASLQPEARIFVIPNGTDVEYFRPDPNAVETPYSMVFAGGMTWYPNEDAMIYFCEKLFPRIRAEVPAATMKVIGARPPRRVLEAAHSNEGIEVLGFVDDVRPHIAKASLYVVPIRVGGGTRLKILDALAMGKAVLSTVVGAEGLSVGHDRDILLAASDDDFVRQAVTALNDAELRARLGARARETASSVYSWEAIVPLFEEALCFAADSRGAA